MADFPQTSFTEEQRRTLQHFDSRSDYWHDVYQHQGSFASYTLNKQHDFILQRIHAYPEAKCILDVGCGTGVTAIKLAQEGYQVSGLDIAPRMIQRAHDKACDQGVKIDFKVGLAEMLPYPPGTFDVIVALGLLGNILDDAPVLNEMARALKPGGHLLVTIPNMLAFDLWLAFPRSLPIILGATRFRQPLRALGNMGRRLLGHPIKEASTLRQNQCVIPRQYVKHLQHHGFSDVTYRALTFGPIQPFGLHLVSQQASIKMSEKLAQLNTTMNRLNWAGTIIVYEALRSAD